jgi:hypothetical protein
VCLARILFQLHKWCTFCNLLSRVKTFVGGNRARRWTPTQQPPFTDTLLRRGNGQRPPRRNPTLALLIPHLFLLLLLYFYPYHYALRETKYLEPKDRKCNKPFGALFSLRCVLSFTRIPPFIGGSGSTPPLQLHLFLP